MQIEFNSKERQILMDALTHDPYIKKVEQPKTPSEVQAIYAGLLKKLATKEVEATVGRPIHAIEVLRKEINFINFKFPEMNAKEKAAATDAIIDLDRAKAYLEDL